MLAQQVSKFFPLLVALSLLSGLVGAVLAETLPDHACFLAPPGGANRQPPCIPWHRCYWGPEITGTCTVGGRDYPILSGNNFVELDYRYCRDYQGTKCKKTTPQPCMWYVAYIDAQCETRPPDCYGYIKVPGCETILAR